VGAASFIVVIAISAGFMSLPRGAEQNSPDSAGSPVAVDSIVSSSASPSPGTVPAAVSDSPSGPEQSLGPTFQPINVFATPTPAPARGAFPTDPSFFSDSLRPLPTQSTDWLGLKASGRVALVDGQITVLGAAVDPLAVPSTGVTAPARRVLDTSWTRWIVEPPGYGSDEKGNHYSDLSYWNLCGDGAATVALWYWQQLTGHPDVTGIAGYFLDPYANEGVPWPTGGPTVAVSNGTRIGTYWSGSDRVSGFTANGRGFLMYLAMAAQPATWQATGLAVFARGGKALYPTAGTSRQNILAGLNWEVSGHDPNTWTEAYYTSVIRSDPTLARDLSAAVTLDVGRDGVPVVAAVDTFNLPNWQAGSATPHTRHAVAIVGYDNTSKPPTFTYIDTCGRSCNDRGGNQNGQIHVIPQSQMVLAIQNVAGSGFIW
jgi:hypothetical protein